MNHFFAIFFFCDHFFSITFFSITLFSITFFRSHFFDHLFSITSLRSPLFCDHLFFAITSFSITLFFNHTFLRSHYLRSHYLRSHFLRSPFCDHFFAITFFSITFFFSICLCLTIHIATALHLFSACTLDVTSTVMTRMHVRSSMCAHSPSSGSSVNESCTQDTEQKHGKHGSGAPLNSFPLILAVVLAEHGGRLSSVDRDREL